MSVKENKNEIRRSISLLKKQYSADWRSRTSLKILERLEENDLFPDAKTILIYHALGDEVQTLPFIEKWHRAKRIILPVVEGEYLLLREYAPENMQTGSYSIQEPATGNNVHPSEIDLAVIPGVAFDRHCNRLGRGKGYYDRLLPQLNAPTIGIAFSFQICESVPTEPFDQPIDLVITETQLIQKQQHKD